PWRRSELTSGGPQCPVPPGNRGFSRSPDARTRQIQIRNRQQDLHTAAGTGWQAEESDGADRGLTRNPAFGRTATLGKVPGRVVGAFFRCWTTATPRRGWWPSHARAGRGGHRG